MSQEFLIEVLCKTEDKVVGTFRTASKLDAIAMRNVEDQDMGRYPQKPRDGIPQHCGKCDGQLYFRDGEGNEMVLVPGSYEVDPTSVKE